MHVGSSVSPSAYASASVWSPPGPHSVPHVRRSPTAVVVEDAASCRYGEQVNPQQSERTTRVLPPPLRTAHGQQLAAVDFEQRRSTASLYGAHLPDHGPEQHFQELYSFNRPSPVYGYYQQQQQHWAPSSSSLRSVSAR